jgi:hypothetical protein
MNERGSYYVVQIGLLWFSCLSLYIAGIIGIYHDAKLRSLRYFIFFICFVALEMEPRALYILGKHTTSEIHPQPHLIDFNFSVLLSLKIGGLTYNHAYVFL